MRCSRTCTAQLNPLEEASAYQQLLADFGITQEELGQPHRSVPPPDHEHHPPAQAALPRAAARRGRCAQGRTRTSDPAAADAEAMERLADKIVNEDLSVRAAEAAAPQERAGRRSRPRSDQARAQLDEVAERLGDRLNTRVKVTLGAQKGRVAIEFATSADLNRILSELGAEDFAG